MDSGGPSLPNGLQQWGIYALEWHGLQFRDNHASKYEVHDIGKPDNLCAYRLTTVL